MTPSRWGYGGDGYQSAVVNFIANGITLAGQSVHLPPLIMKHYLEEGDFNTERLKAIADANIRNGPLRYIWIDTLKQNFDKHWNQVFYWINEINQSHVTETTFSSGPMAGSTVDVRLRGFVNPFITYPRPDEKIVIPQKPSYDANEHGYLNTDYLRYPEYAMGNTLAVHYQIQIKNPPQLKSIPVDVRIAPSTEGYIQTSYTDGIEKVFMESVPQNTNYNKNTATEYQYRPVDSGTSMLARTVKGNLTEDKSLLNDNEKQTRYLPLAKKKLSMDNMVYVNERKEYKKSPSYSFGYSDQFANVAFFVKNGYLKPSVGYQQYEIAQISKEKTPPEIFQFKVDTQSALANKPYYDYSSAQKDQNFGYSLVSKQTSELPGIAGQAYAGRHAYLIENGEQEGLPVPRYGLSISQNLDYYNRPTDTSMPVAGKTLNGPGYDNRRKMMYLTGNTSSLKLDAVLQHVPLVIDPNGGTFNGNTDLGTVDVLSETSRRIPAEKPERSGKVFLGYQLVNDKNEVIRDDYYQPSDMVDYAEISKTKPAARDGVEQYKKLILKAQYSDPNAPVTDTRSKVTVLLQPRQGENQVIEQYSFDGVPGTKLLLRKNDFTPEKDFNGHKIFLDKIKSKPAFEEMTFEEGKEIAIVYYSDLKPVIIDPVTPEPGEHYVRVTYNPGEGKKIDGECYVFDVLKQTPYDQALLYANEELKAAGRSVTVPPQVTPPMGKGFSSWKNQPDPLTTPLEQNLELIAQYGDDWYIVPGTDPVNPGDYEITFGVLQQDEEHANLGTTSGGEKVFKVRYGVRKDAEPKVKLNQLPLPRATFAPGFAAGPKPWGRKYEEAKDYDITQDAQYFLEVRPYIIDPKTPEPTPGFARIRFLKGDHGKFPDDKKTVFDVNKEYGWTDLRRLIEGDLGPNSFPPIPIANDKYTFVGWKPALPTGDETISENTDFVAQYKADIYPLDDPTKDPVDGFMKVTFQIAEADRSPVSKADFGKNNSVPVYQVAYGVKKDKGYKLEDVPTPAASAVFSTGYVLNEDKPWKDPYTADRGLEVKDKSVYDLNIKPLDDVLMKWYPEPINDPSDFVKPAGYKKVTFTINSDMAFVRDDQHIAEKLRVPKGKNFLICYVNPTKNIVLNSFAPVLTYNIGYGQPEDPNSPGYGPDQGWNMDYKVKKTKEITKDTDEKKYEFTSQFIEYKRIEDKERPGYIKITFKVKDKSQGYLDIQNGDKLYERDRWVNPTKNVTFGELGQKRAYAETGYTFLYYCFENQDNAIDDQIEINDKLPANQRTVFAKFVAKQVIVNPDPKEEPVIDKSGRYWKLIFKSGDGKFKLADVANMERGLEKRGSRSNPADETLDKITIEVLKSEFGGKLTWADISEELPNPVPNDASKPFLYFTEDQSKEQPPKSGPITADASYTAQYKQPSVPPTPGPEPGPGPAPQPGPGPEPYIPPVTPVTPSEPACPNKDAVPKTGEHSSTALAYVLLSLAGTLLLLRRRKERVK